MSFQPVVPFGGLAGWSFLDRTRAAQQAAFDASSSLARDTDYFAARIGSVTTAEDLVADRRLLQVALGAFGLDADIDNRYFLRRILEDGTTDPKALANRLSDKRYLEMSKSFGFGDLSPPNTVLSDFAETIVARYRERQFEVGVGRSDENMRLALSLERELGAALSRVGTEDGRWYAVMGTPPLRAVFEAALGLPASTGSLDLDQQLRLFKEKSRRQFGAETVTQFGVPEGREKLLRRFLLRSEIAATGAAGSAAANALSLLQSGRLELRL